MLCSIAAGKLDKLLQVVHRKRSCQDDESSNSCAVQKCTYKGTVRYPRQQLFVWFEQLAVLEAQAPLSKAEEVLSFSQQTLSVLQCLQR